MTREGFRGYCVHQSFNGLRVPVPFQNVLLRDFLARKGLMFKLSVNELDFPGCHVQLMSLLDQLADLQGIVMASLFMLPADAAARQEVYRRVQTAGATVYFVMENTALSDGTDAERVEDLFRMARLLPHCPRRIDATLLAASLPGDPRFSTRAAVS